MERDARKSIAGIIRACAARDRGKILRIINAAAEAYRGVIPADCWHDPYMSIDELDLEIAHGVRFSGFETERGLAGVMGVQRVRNVDLIRHSYVLPAWQGHGVASALLTHLCHERNRPILIGTWQDATWAIRFYERHHFTRCASEEAATLLRTYWMIRDRQIATSVVLSSPPLNAERTASLIEQVTASRQ
jgi:GNAT superfamily N-acetyltransferase